MPVGLPVLWASALVKLPKNNFNENEPVVFDAELYDENYELTNQPDINLKVFDGEGKEYPFQFSKTARAYQLDAGRFPVGNYRYEASTIFNSKPLNTSGAFSVSPLRLEALQTSANHNLLHLLSEQYGGGVYYNHQLSDLINAIQGMDEIQSVFYNTYKTEAFINLKWFFFLIMTLLAIEWFIRKWNGAY